MDRTILWVGLGGFIGSVCRYYTAVLATRFLPLNFPYGTFVAYIVGCLLIGVFYGFSARFCWFIPRWMLFLTTGFCGGYTTFSTFMYDNVKLLQSGQYWAFGGY